MASRKLVGGLLLSNRSFYRRLLTSQQVSNAYARLSLVPNNGSWGYRRFGVFSEFWEEVKVEANRCTHTPQSLFEIQLLKESPKLLKERMDEIKEKADDVKEKVDKIKGSTEDTEKFSWVSQEFGETHNVMSEKMDELQGLAEDLGKLSWTSWEFGETIKVMLEKAKEADRAMEDLKISVAKVEKLYKTEEVEEAFGIGKEESSTSSATSAKDDVKNRSNATSRDRDTLSSYPMKLLRKLFTQS